MASTYVCVICKEHLSDHIEFEQHLKGLNHTKFARQERNRTHFIQNKSTSSHHYGFYPTEEFSKNCIDTTAVRSKTESLTEKPNAVSVKAETAMGDINFSQLTESFAVKPNTVHVKSEPSADEITCSQLVESFAVRPNAVNVKSEPAMDDISFSQVTESCAVNPSQVGTCRGRHQLFSAG